MYFVVASGFTLIFGLMRIVNMAHGSFYLLGGYIAFELAQVRLANYWLALIVAALAIGAGGLVVQQVFLRWNQGQELRQALITIALSIIIADQMLANFGGSAVTISPPTGLGGSLRLGVYGIQYPTFRFAVLAGALVIGLFLWIWIMRTRFGMTIRAGVDDRSMTAALGVNIQVIFAITFFAGALLAGLGGVMGGTMIALAPGQDASFLLSSLVVVIIGGLGSLRGAVVGSIALGLVDQLSAVYLPASYTNYSILLTFVLLVFVLATRPAGLFGRRGPAGQAQESQVRLQVRPARLRASIRNRPLFAWLLLRRAGIAGLLIVVALVPWLFPAFFASSVGVQTLVLGIAAASLIFLNAIAGMVSLAQTALYGVAAYTTAQLAVQDGVDPWLAAIAALVVTVLVGLLLGAIVSRSEGIYFLMITLAFAVITYYFFSQVTVFGSHEGINNVQPPRLIGLPFVDPTGLYYAALICSGFVYLSIRYVQRTPFGLALQGIRDEPTRMKTLGFNVQLLRASGFALGAFFAAIAGVLSVWYNSNISPGAIDLTRTIDLLMIAVIGGIWRLEGAWIGAVLFTLLDTYSPAYTAHFETVIGLIFLAVVLLSPGGLAGIFSRVDGWVRLRLGETTSEFTLRKDELLTP
jgi:ABC-type branched-subunit amino acid transport system permease subunit